MVLIMIDDLKALYSSLSNKEKAYSISNIALLLTVYARDTYQIDSEDVEEPRKLRLYNELYHTLHGQLCTILKEGDDNYPDDVFIDILCEKARKIGILERFCSVFSKLLLNRTGPDLDL
jgi:hypothetical protein